MRRYAWADQLPRTLKSNLLACVISMCCAGALLQAQEPKPKPKPLKDGETAVIVTALSETDLFAKVKDYFNSKDIDFTTNLETSRVSSDWYGERGCGIGFNKCANRAMVRVVVEEGQAVLRVQVFERKREAGLSPKPWNENAKSKGKATAEFAGELEVFVTR